MAKKKQVLNRVLYSLFRYLSAIFLNVNGAKISKVSLAVGFTLAEKRNGTFFCE